MKSYIIIQEENMIDCEKVVNGYLLKGYEPQGGIFVRDIGMSAYYLQAMIKGE